jgi:hypothetical protein
MIPGGCGTSAVAENWSVSADLAANQLGSFNQREIPFLFRDTLCRPRETEKMEYQELIST